MSTSGAAAEAAEFRTYARRRGLTYYEHWGLPAATQLLRQGFARAAPNLALGELPDGLGNGWLAHASYTSTSATGIAEHEFTVVITRVPASIGFAVRVVCHDRNLRADARSNPDAGAEVIELDDHDIELESVRLLERYAIATDHDQDRLVVWQLFSPALVHWLTEDAPARFSFELQDGALCCFVPGFVANEEALDALCEAAGRVHHRVVELATTNPAIAATAPTRLTIVDAEIAARAFDRPPESVFEAARAFGWWGLVTGRSWGLGAEAFFRAYAARNGFGRIDDAAFRARHIQTPFPGQITQIAAGHLAGVEAPAWIILTKDPKAMSGWLVLVVDPRDRDHLYAHHGLPEIEAAEREGFYVVVDGRSLIIFKPDAGSKRRTTKQLDAFMATARDVTVAVADAIAVEAGRRR